MYTYIVYIHIYIYYILDRNNGSLGKRQVAYKITFGFSFSYVFGIFR